jgi:hypothetical protein
MSNAWTHLPNAHHIDWVLASLKETPKLWDAARDAARDAAWDEARAAAMSAARDAVWDAARGAAWAEAWAEAWDTARDAARAAARAAARSVISALVAYDDCDQFLNMPYEKLKVWTVLSEDLRAVLLLPMVYVREKLNEQCLVTSA